MFKKSSPEAWEARYKVYLVRELKNSNYIEIFLRNRYLCIHNKSRERICQNLFFF